uniref:Ferredoxin n=1 Tax=Ascaris lumbricoides TaxID=6252 RepID=A0A0M3ID86_ASCLU
MDTVVLNVGHTQLEEQLKIAAACGIAEQNRVEENVDVDDDTELTVDYTNEAHDCVIECPSWSSLDFKD